MTHVETRATLRNAGPVWMLEQMQGIIDGWQIRDSLDGCGVGFGGPVHFPEQRVIYSTHVSGWDDFDLSGELQRMFGARSSWTGTRSSLPWARASTAPARA
jgi:glucokinase